jgi:3-hydroxyisobutyrate dehydrogenase-like beta-hydroxyacid dehydrogenase
MAKDLRLGTEAAAEAGIATPVLTAAALAYEAVVAAGSGDADAAVLIDTPAGAGDAAILTSTPGGPA